MKSNKVQSNTQKYDYNPCEIPPDSNRSDQLKTNQNLMKSQFVE